MLKKTPTESIDFVSMDTVVQHDDISEMDDDSASDHGVLLETISTPRGINDAPLPSPVSAQSRWRDRFFALLCGLFSIAAVGVTGFAFVEGFVSLAVLGIVFVLSVVVFIAALPVLLHKPTKEEDTSPENPDQMELTFDYFLNGTDQSESDRISNEISRDCPKKSLKF